MTRRIRRLMVPLASNLALAGLILTGAPAPTAAETQDVRPEPLTCANCAGGQCAQLRCFEKGGDLTIAPCSRLEPGCTGEGGYLEPGTGWGAPGPRDPGPDCEGESWDDECYEQWERDLWECRDATEGDDGPLGNSHCRDLDDLRDSCRELGGRLERTPAGYKCEGWSPSEGLYCGDYRNTGRVFLCHTYPVFPEENIAPDPRGPLAPRTGKAAGFSAPIRRPGVVAPRIVHFPKAQPRILERPKVLEPRILEIPAAVSTPAAPAELKRSEASPATPKAKPVATMRQCSDAPEPRVGFVWKCDHWERPRAR